MIASRYRFHGHGSLKFLYKNGQAIRSRYFTVKYCRNARRSDPRFSVVISKKVHKSAVGRNRVRRRIYERLRQDVLPNVRSLDVVVIVTSGEVLGLSAEDLRQALEQLLSQLPANNS